MEERSQCLRLADAEVSVRAKEGLVPATWRSQLGVVVPMPTEPVSSMRMASVKPPARSVEKARFPFPVLKFWVRMLVMAAVVVPFVSMPPEGVVEPASVLKERREAVEVAEARFERNSWSCVAPDEVLTTSSFV